LNIHHQSVSVHTQNIHPHNQDQIFNNINMNANFTNANQTDDLATYSSNNAREGDRNNNSIKNSNESPSKKQEFSTPTRNGQNKNSKIILNKIKTLKEEDSSLTNSIDKKFIKSETKDFSKTIKPEYETPNDKELLIEGNVEQDLNAREETLFTNRDLTLTDSKEKNN